MLKKLLSILLPRDAEAHRAETYRRIIRESAQMGGSLFGPVAPGGRREFFCLDEHTWVWHEEWTDVGGMRHARTTRYDIRPHGILKAQDGEPYQRVGAEETSRLLAAMQAYQQRLHEKYDPLLAVAA